MSARTLRCGCTAVDTCRLCLVAARAEQERPRLVAIATRRLRRADAEDVAAEAIARAVERSATLDPERVGGWLRTVTLNLCTDVYRKRARERPVELLEERQEGPSAEVAALDELAVSDLCRQIRALLPRQQAVLMLRADGESIPDIASALSIGYKTTESLLARARAALRSRIAVLVAPVGVRLDALRRSLRACAPALAAIAVAGGTAGLLSGAAHGHPASVMSRAPLLPPALARPAIVSVPAVPLSAAGAHYAPTAAGQRPAGRRARVAESPRQIGALPPVTAGPARADGGPVVTEHDRNRTLQQSVVDCLSGGVVLNTNTIGCQPREG